MLLKKIFKPKWQSNNPEVRESAVAQLDWNMEEDRKILKSVILNDAEPGVAHLALSKVFSLNDLMTLFSISSETNRAIIRDRIVQLIKNAKTDEEFFVERSLRDCDTAAVAELTTLLRKSEHLKSIIEIVSRQLPDHLVALATLHPLSLIRQIAADHAYKPEHLADIATKVKSKDKGVYQKVKAKLQNYRQEEQKIASLHKNLEDLCQNIESHAETDVTKYYIEKLEALKRNYQSVLPNPDHFKKDIPADQSLTSRIEVALEKCTQKATELELSIKADHNQQQATQQQAIERKSTIQQLAETINQLKNSPAIDSAELAALDGLLRTQQNRWQEATRHHPASEDEFKAYQLAKSELLHYINARNNLKDQLPELTSLLNLAKTKVEAGATVDKDLLQKLRQCINSVEWPEGFNLPDPLKKSAAIVGQIQTIQTQHSEDADKLRKKLEQKIDKLSKHINEGELKQALRLAKTVRSDLNHVPESFRQKLNSQLKTQQNRLNELKDWQGYATLPKQEKLCERMAYLANQHLEPHIKAQRIKELQNEWRSLGGSPNQKLWQKFKKLADAAYEPCKDFFGEEDKLKEVNLEKRKSICHELTDFTEQIDWNKPDWKAIDRINKKAREEWRIYYPVDHKKGKPVQQNFNHLLLTLDEKLDQEKNINHAKKQDIVGQANALLALEDIRTATAQAKALQKQWQQVGITDHKKDRELWAEFRKACDQIFAKLEQRRNQQREQQELAIARAKELIRATNDLQDNINESTQTALASFAEAFEQQIDNLGEAQRSLRKAFQDAVNSVRNTIKQQKSEEFVRYYTNLICHVFVTSGELESISARGLPTCSEIAQIKPDHLALLTSDTENQHDESARDLLIRLEILAEIDSPESEKARRMALQVARLAKGISNAPEKKESAQKQFECHLMNWVRVKQPDDLNLSHYQRLINVVEKISLKLSA